MEQKEEQLFIEDDIDYCDWPDEAHCHEFEDEWDEVGHCVPLHRPADDCPECNLRYN